MVAVLIMTAVMPHHGFSQSNLHLQAFSRQSVGLNDDQIAAIRNGQAVAKALPSRTRFTSMLLLKRMFGLPTISTDFASFPAIWASACSAVLHSFLT